MDLINEVLNPAVVEKLQKATGTAGPILKTYMEATETAFNEWTAAAATEPIPEADPEADPDAKKQLPLYSFQKAGFIAAYEEIRPLLEEMGGSVAERVKVLGVSADQRSTDMRRCLDQLLQELVVANVKENVFPQIDKLVSKNKRLVGPIAKKVKELVYDQTESMARKEMHKGVVRGYKDMNATILPPEFDAAPEGGEVQAEDVFGFLESEGGYKAFQGSSGGLGALGLDPMMFVKKVVSPEIIDRLKHEAEEAQLMLEIYKVKAAAVRDRWLAEEGGKKRLDKAGTNQKKLAKIEVPTVAFQQAALFATAELVISKLQALGGPMVERLETIKVTAEQRSTDIRRSLDQLLQEMVVSKARQHIFPELETRIKNIKVPGGMPLPGRVLEKVSSLVFDLAEGEVRKQVHVKVGHAFTRATADLVPAGCAMSVEVGTEQAEDEFGL